MSKPIVKVSDEQIIRALEDCHGSYRLAANKLKIAYGTIITRAKHNPDIKQAVVDAAGDMIAMAEDSVYNELLQGNFNAAKFVLERLAKDKWGKSVQIVDPEVPYPQPSWD